MKIRIHPCLIPDNRLGTVTGIDGGLCREMGNDGGKTVDELLPRAAWKVGTAYTHAEKCVTRKGNVFCFTIEDDAAGRMTGGVEHPQLMTTKRDDIIMGENGANRDIVKGGAKVEPHHAALLVKVLYHRLIIGMSLRLQSEDIVYEGSSKHMVKMPVRTEMMHGDQLLLLDIVPDSQLFGVIKGTAIDDDTLGSLVAHHVAVLLQGIHLENLDRKHGYSGK